MSCPFFLRILTVWKEIVVWLVKLSMCPKYVFSLRECIDTSRTSSCRLFFFFRFPRTLPMITLTSLPRCAYVVAVNKTPAAAHLTSMRCIIIITWRSMLCRTHRRMIFRVRRVLVFPAILCLMSLVSSLVLFFLLLHFRSFQQTSATAHSYAPSIYDTRRCRQLVNTNPPTSRCSLLCRTHHILF